jgi:hypothetical protein
MIAKSSHTEPEQEDCLKGAVTINQVDVNVHSTETRNGYAMKRSYELACKRRESLHKNRKDLYF